MVEKLNILINEIFERNIKDEKYSNVIKKYKDITEDNLVDYGKKVRLAIILYLLTSDDQNKFSELLNELNELNEFNKINKENGKARISLKGQIFNKFIEEFMTFKQNKNIDKIKILNQQFNTLANYIRENEQEAVYEFYLESTKIQKPIEVVKFILNPFDKDAIKILKIYSLLMEIVEKNYSRSITTDINLQILYSIGSRFALFASQSKNINEQARKYYEEMFKANNTSSNLVNLCADNLKHHHNQLQQIQNSNKSEDEKNREIEKLKKAFQNNNLLSSMQAQHTINNVISSMSDEQQANYRNLYESATGITPNFVSSSSIPGYASAGPSETINLQSVIQQQMQKSLSSLFNDTQDQNTEVIQYLLSNPDKYFTFVNKTTGINLKQLIENNKINSSEMCKMS